ncbi:Transcriptional regulator [Gryganskiella cystojenkinii]|nr:Transcriptional regulator [Gryganskiella cystojenkinii]
MDTPTLSSFDPNALTFRSFVNRQPSSTPSSTNSSTAIPSYQELATIQQELQELSDRANLRYEQLNSELQRLENGGSSGVISHSKDSSVSSTPTSTSSSSVFNSTLPAGGLSSSTSATLLARASASPNATSPSSFVNGSRAGGSSGSLPSGTAPASSPIVKLKIKRPDAPESAKTDDEQSASSTPTTVKNRTGTPSISQDGFQKKRKKRDLDDDSEYSEDERAAIPKSKRGDDFSLIKTGRSMSPQPMKLAANRASLPKATQQRMGDKGHSSSQQKKKKNSDHHTEKSQKPMPKVQEVQEDFSKVKVANQVPIATFWASMDPYFRPFTESDRIILEEEGDPITPLMIPPLGKHYIDAWAEEDRSLMPFEGFESRRNSVDSLKDTAPSRNLVNSTPFELTDENLEQDEVSCGPLTERLLSSLIAEEVIEPKEVKDDEDEQNTVQSGPQNYAELEERMKRELRYIGLLGNEEINWDAREDDEISITLRSLQKELRDVMKVNKSRKQRLLGLVNNHLAYQEYNTILDDLDKQVEQGYLKRIRNTKAKKSKKTAAPKSLSENAIQAMDRRKRFVQGLGPLFPPENYTIPTKSIYQDELQPKVNSSTPLSYRELNGLP